MIPSYFTENFSARGLLLEHLELARSHVELGEQHIAQQKQLIDRLRDGGRATATAHRTLNALETTQAMYVANHKRLETELATANPE